MKQTLLCILMTVISLVPGAAAETPLSAGWVYKPGPLPESEHFSVQTETMPDGYIMDMAIGGNILYTLITTKDRKQQPSVIVLSDLQTGRQLDVWEVGDFYAVALCYESDGLYVVSRSKSNFLTTFDTGGRKTGTFRINAYPEGKLYGLAKAGDVFYFSMWDRESSSAVYSFHPESGEAAEEHRVAGKIHALGYGNGTLRAALTGFDGYAEHWLWDLDPDTWRGTKYRFLNGTTWGLDYQDGVWAAMRRSGEGQLSFSFEIDADARIIRGGYTERSVRITFPYKNSTANAYSIDFWFAGPLEKDIQILRNFNMSPPPEGVTDDYYGNPWLRSNVSHTAGDTDFVLEFDIAQFEQARTIDPDYVFDTADVPPDILEEYTKETYCFDYSAPVLQQALDGLDLSGSYIENLIAIRDDVNDRLEVTGPSGAESQASRYIQQGTGRCYGHTLSFAALARGAGYPVRAIAGIVIDRSHAEADTPSHTWNQVYFPGTGWVDFDAQKDDSADGDHRHRYIGYRSGRYIHTFVGGYEKRDREQFFAQRSFFSTSRWQSSDRNNKASVKRGIIRVESRDYRR